MSFRQLLISIAGLWVLCSVQNQTHPHRYINYSSNSSSEQAVHAAPIRTDLGNGIVTPDKRASPAPDHNAVLGAAVPLIVVTSGFYLPVSHSVAQSKLYRLFHTGLSPPLLSFNLS